MGHWRDEGVGQIWKGPEPYLGPSGLDWAVRYHREDGGVAWRVGHRETRGAGEARLVALGHSSWPGELKGVTASVPVLVPPLAATRHHTGRGLPGPGSTHQVWGGAGVGEGASVFIRSPMTSPIRAEQPFYVFTLECSENIDGQTAERSSRAFGLRTWK